jgi:hypothetical protein
MKVTFEVDSHQDGYESVEIQQNAFKNNERLLAVQQYISDKKKEYDDIIKRNDGLVSDVHVVKKEMIDEFDKMFNQIVGARK